MLVFGEFGIMLGCTLGGVRGDCNGDRIRLHMFWGPAVSHVVVEMPPALRVPVVMEVQIWVQM
jgi:hypothetical protein